MHYQTIKEELKYPKLFGGMRGVNFTELKPKIIALVEVLVTKDAAAISAQLKALRVQPRSNLCYYYATPSEDAPHDWLNNLSSDPQLLSLTRIALYHELVELSLTCLGKHLPLTSQETQNLYQNFDALFFQVQQDYNCLSISQKALVKPPRHCLQLALEKFNNTQAAGLAISFMSSSICIMLWIEAARWLPKDSQTYMLFSVCLLTLWGAGAYKIANYVPQRLQNAQAFFLFVEANSPQARENLSRSTSADSRPLEQESRGYTRKRL